jgi:SagB-type dehydrogenase family enzyme
VTRDVVVRYHDGTKHHFHRFAQSLGYLDWASQPNPFRSFAGAPIVSLPFGTGETFGGVAYDQLFQLDAVAPRELSAASIGGLLRHALGLSAWKEFRESRWALRVNPSSGNLHPTEAYVVAGPVSGLSDAAGVYHYAPDRHGLETRAVFSPDAWRGACGSRPVFLIALTSIHWREAWKYGERAFRYCQHDLGHAIAALRLSAALAGWRIALQPGWSQPTIAALVGVDRDADYVDAEREEPACLLLVTADAGAPLSGEAPAALVDAARHGAWQGRANQLSADHVEWTFIDEVARATEDEGRITPAHHLPMLAGPPPLPAPPASPALPALPARSIILQRRSALAFDGRSTIDRDRFERILTRAMPGAHAPWDALWWDARIHLVLFVHRVDGLAPGLYLLPRDGRPLDRFKAAFGREFLWEPASAIVPLVCLAHGDCRRLAARLSCDQEIASDGFFSLAMLAEFDASLDEFGASFYRHLFWESGVVGQVLYLEAEAAGARATGIGCFYDDSVHDALGIDIHRGDSRHGGHAFQSLYHFTVGTPVEDLRLTTAPGYGAEPAPGEPPAID